jgi:hypothetical protein
MTLFLLLACVEVVKPPVEPLAQPVDEPTTHVNWAAYEAELSEMLISDPNMDADRRDRLTAAVALVDALERGDVPEDSAAKYLDALLVIEARAEPTEMDEVPVLIPRVTEEVIDTGFDTALGPDDARALLAEERYVEALRGLEPVQDQHPALYAEAVDGYVHTERERAGELFLQARDMPEGEVRDSAIEEVVSILERLLAEYPDSTYTGEIEQNLAKVREG